MYTLEDLEQARAELGQWQDSFDRYTGNNPDKYQSDMKAVRRKVRLIEYSLKAAGVLPLSEEERLEQSLGWRAPTEWSIEIVSA